jgi:hypothetical protein
MLAAARSWQGRMLANDHLSVEMLLTQVRLERIAE